MSDVPTKPKKSETAPKEDVVLLHSPTQDGAGVRVLRAREGRVEAGEVRPLEQGKPISGEVVSLQPREKTPWLCDVDVRYAPEKSSAEGSEKAARGKGPSQVASDEYREHWEAIFGGKVVGVNRPREVANAEQVDPKKMLKDPKTLN